MNLTSMALHLQLVSAGKAVQGTLQRCQSGPLCGLANQEDLQRKDFGRCSPVESERQMNGMSSKESLAIVIDKLMDSYCFTHTVILHMLGELAF